MRSTKKARLLYGEQASFNLFVAIFCVKRFQNEQSFEIVDVLV